jgi:hypothetical protein
VGIRRVQIAPRAGNPYAVAPPVVVANADLPLRARRSASARRLAPGATTEHYALVSVPVPATFSVSNLEDLTLSQRAIAAARFVSRESDVLLGSPRMAELHTQVFDAIVKAAGEHDANRPDGWTAFRQLSNNPAHVDTIVASEDEVERLAEMCRSQPPG